MFKIILKDDAEKQLELLKAQRNETFDAREIDEINAEIKRIENAHRRAGVKSFLKHGSKVGMTVILRKSR